MCILLLVARQAVGKAPPLVQEVSGAEGLPIARVHLTKHSVLRHRAKGGERNGTSTAEAWFRSATVHRTRCASRNASEQGCT